MILIMKKTQLISTEHNNPAVIQPAELILSVLDDACDNISLITPHSRSSPLLCGLKKFLIKTNTENQKTHASPDARDAAEQRYPKMLT